MNCLSLADAKNQYPKICDFVHVMDLRRAFICVSQEGLTPDDKYILSTGGGSPLFWVAYEQTQDNIIKLGVMIDGTTLYGKWLSGAFFPGAIVIGMLHGISNAYIDKRICGIIPWVDYDYYSPNGVMVSVSDTAFDYTPRLSAYDNLNVYIYRTIPTNSYDIYALVIYK